MAPPKDRTIRQIMANRKARHEYEILQTLEAGIVLTGTEVKSIRAGKVNMTDAYAAFPSKKSNELLLLNLHISPYEFGNRENHEPLRPRKLLLHESELRKLRVMIEEKGLTLIPLALYFSGAVIKVEIGVGRGKKLYDKRQSEKEKASRRESRITE
jgi:SsrA-binding protein